MHQTLVRVHPLDDQYGTSPGRSSRYILWTIVRYMTWTIITVHALEIVTVQPHSVSMAYHNSGSRSPLGALTSALDRKISATSIDFHPTRLQGRRIWIMFRVCVWHDAEFCLGRKRNCLNLVTAHQHDFFTRYIHLCTN